MKEIKILESWCDNILNEKFVGQPSKSIGDRPLPRSQDIQYQAQLKYPDRGPEQALSMFINDKMKDSEKMDFEQNKLINSQKRENDKLRRTLTDLSNELHDHERTAQDTEREVQRLRDLSGKLKPAGEIQQQIAKDTSEKIDAMIRDVETLKTKPGVNDKQYNELMDQVKKLRSMPNLSTGDISNLRNELANLSKLKEVDDEALTKLNTDFSELKSKYERKEQRFSQYVRDTNQNIKSYQKKFDELHNELDSAKSELSNATSQLQGAEDRAKAEIKKVSDEALKNIQLLARKIRGADSEEEDVSNILTGIGDIEDEDEVQQQMANPSATTLKTLADIDIDPKDIKKYSKLKSQVPNDEGDTRIEPGFDDTEDEIDITGLDDLIGDKETNKIAESTLEAKMTKAEQIEKILIPRLIQAFAKLYPQDAEKYGINNLREIIDRTIDGSLLLHKPVDKEKIKTYLGMVRVWLHKTKPVEPVDMFGDPQNISGGTKKKEFSYRPDYEWPPSSDQFSESLVRQYEKSLNKLTNGF